MTKTNEDDLPFHMLALDGGGVRGLISARILQEIETRAQQPIATLFDVVLGNSAGGLIALGLTVPGPDGMPKYTANDFVRLYQQYAKMIFNSSFWSKLTSGWGLWGPKYQRDGLDKLLEDYFSDSRMSSLLRPVLIPSFCIDKSKPSLWGSVIAKKEPTKDHLVKDIAGATSAAPTYFPPKILEQVDGTRSYEIDGGVWANSPTAVALLGLMKGYNPNQSGTGNNHVIAIGTGKVKFKTDPNKLMKAGVYGWLKDGNLLDMMMNGASEWEDAHQSSLHTVHRLQVDLPKELSAMDDASEANIQALLSTAEQFIEDNSTKIDSLCEQLSKARQRWFVSRHPSHDHKTHAFPNGREHPQHG